MTRQDIILSMKNRYDFAEFKQLSAHEGLTEISWLLYVQVVETLDMAMEKYPDMVPYDAYLKFLGENNNTLAHKEIPVPLDAPRVPCSSCGGGKVL